MGRIQCAECNGTGEVSDVDRKARTASARLALARANRHKIIHERAMLILALAKHGVGCSVHIVPQGATDELGKGDKWRRVLCLHTPIGQIHWKLSPEDEAAFKKLDVRFDSESDWDGAKAKTKIERLDKLHTVKRGKSS
jgi:hypothetical protein